MEKNGTFVHCWWEYKLVQPLWKIVQRLLKKKKKIGLLLFDPAVSLLGIFPKKTNTNVKQYLHPWVHCSIIYHSQDMEAFIDRWMDKEDVISIY